MDSIDFTLTVLFDVPHRVNIFVAYVFWTFHENDRTREVTRGEEAQRQDKRQNNSTREASKGREKRQDEKNNDRTREATTGPEKQR